MTHRRIFIKNTLGSLAALTFANQAFPLIRTTAPRQNLGVALVGLGYYSTDLLAPALQLTKHCSLKGIITGSSEKAKKWQQQYKIPEKNTYDYEGFKNIANNPDIDIIYIVLPPSMHAEYVIKAAEAGKHVWCEKPMAVTVDECQSMIDACKKNKVKLSIGYRMQHEPNTQKIIQFRKDKTYGNITKVSAAAGYFDSRTNHWKQIKALGGGSMYDMGVYPLNATRYVTGEEPVAVTARQSTTRPEIYKEVDETMQFTLEFPGGAIAECETSFGKNMNALQVTCTNGWYKLEPFQAYSGIKGTTSDGKALNAVIPNQQAKQMDDDALSIIQNKQVLVPGEEGLRDIRVVEAIYRSVKQGARVVI
ncbi:MAG: Gfo/Idh/MocA family oxidoreductase [Chitinophagaceae bacterium]|nr:Gfo/Idh/MocA family oxidoreductase [Chitinophagaceae bacterium]